MSAMNKEEDIKTMKLYSNVDRVYNELEELGIKPEDPIKVDVLNQFDNYHYYGVEAVEECITALGIGQNSVVLDVGSGLGGPARYLANRCKCHVIAIELQGNIHQTATDLTRRCGLSDNIRHIHGDFLQKGHGIEEGSVDFLVSWLVFLHIDEKGTLLQECRRALKPGGKIAIEDMICLNQPTLQEKDVLHQELYITRLDTREEYIQHLEQAGFKDIHFEDLSAMWSDFVRARLENHIASRERYVRVHNEQIYQEQLRFFKAVDGAFSGKNTGGCRIVATAN